MFSIKVALVRFSSSESFAFSALTISAKFRIHWRSTSCALGDRFRKDESTRVVPYRELQAARLLPDCSWPERQLVGDSVLLAFTRAEVVRTLEIHRINCW